MYPPIVFLILRQLRRSLGRCRLRERRQIAVARGEVMAIRGEVKSTKTYRVRDVMLSDWAKSVLARQKPYSFHRGRETPIFLNPITGRPWPDVQDQRKLYFHPTLAALKIRKRNAYNTRHTFATGALMGGVNPAFIAKQLGHADAAVTFKYYARWIVGSLEQVETAKLNRIFSDKL